MKRIYTIGHSTRPIEEFVEILQGFDVELLLDIRTVRGSRHNPQYGEAALAAKLPTHGIEYRPLPGLGGLRKTVKDSPNMRWHNASFRGYADYMQTDDFATAMDELVEIATIKTSAIMCAEAVPWRCHRSMVGDALIVRGFEVLDIMGPGKATPHTLTTFAVVDGTQITYPTDEPSP